MCPVALSVPCYYAGNKTARSGQKDEKMAHSTRHDYYNEVQENADEAAESIRRFGGDHLDLLHEAADRWTVYYKDAHSIMRWTDNPDAAAEFDLCFAGESWDGIVTKFAYHAVHADLLEAYSEAYNEDGHAHDGSTFADCPDCNGDGEVESYCGDCDGTEEGTADCGTCKGTGEGTEACGTCDGDGAIPGIDL